MQLTIERLENGYYVIKNEKDQTLKRLPEYNTAIFERLATAVFTVKIFKKELKVTNYGF